MLTFEWRMTPRLALVLALAAVGCGSSQRQDAKTPEEPSEKVVWTGGESSTQDSTVRFTADVGARSAREAADVARAKAYSALPPLPQYPCPAPLEAGGAAPPDATHDGTLDPLVILNVMRARYPILRRCYEAALTDQPDLGGLVQARLIIGEDGAVSQVHPECTNMPDPSVVQCMVTEFETVHFPEPEGGTITVVYPIVFTPGGPNERRAP